MSYKTASIELCILNSNLHAYPDFYTGIEMYITPQNDLTEVGQQYLLEYEDYKLQLVPTVVKMGDWDVNVCMFENVPACIIYCPISIRDNVPIFIVENGEVVYAGEGKIYAGLIGYDPNMSKQATKKDAVLTYLCGLNSPSSEYEEWLLIRYRDILGMSPIPRYVYIYYNKNFISISRHSGSSTYPYIPEDIATYDDSDSDYSSLNRKESAKTRIKCKFGETILIEANLSALNVIIDSIWGDVENNEFLSLINVGNLSYYYTVQDSFTSENEEMDVTNLYVFASSSKYQVTVSTLELPVSYSIYYTNSNQGYNDELWVRYNAATNQTVYHIETVEPTVGDNIEIRFEFDSSEDYTLSSMKIEKHIIKTNDLYTYFGYLYTFDMPNSDVEILWYVTATPTNTEPPSLQHPSTVSVIENTEGHQQTKYITNIWINEQETQSLEVENGSEVTIRWKVDYSKPVSSVLVCRRLEDRRYIIKGIEGSCTFKINGPEVVTLFACGDPFIFDVTTVYDPQTIFDTTAYGLINSHPELWGMSLHGCVLPYNERDGKFIRQYWIPSEKITKVPYNNDGEEIISPLAGGLHRERYKRNIPDSTMCYLPNTITQIEKYACPGCHFQIVIPDSVYTIGQLAFNANFNTKFFKLPNTLRNLNGLVFDDCHGLEGIIGGASIKKISLWASFCSPLLHIVIPEGVTTLCGTYESNLDDGVQGTSSMLPVSGIFVETKADTIYWKAKNCLDVAPNALKNLREKVKTIIFGSAVYTVELQAFLRLKLDTVVFLSSTPPDVVTSESFEVNLKLVAPLASKDLYLNHYFWGKYKDKFEFVSDVSAEYLFPIKYTTTNRTNLLPYRVDFLDLMPIEDIYGSTVGGQLRFVKPLLTIGDWMYAGQEKLASITLPVTITKIGENAFYRCKNLTSINIPKNVTKIAMSAFEESGISNIHWDVSEYPQIKNMTESPFYGHQQIKTLTIGPNVKSIPRYMFGHLKIQELNIPWTVESIGTYAFSSCLDLKKVSIGANVKEIEEYAFVHSPIEEVEWSSYADLNPFWGMGSIKKVVFNESYVSNIPEGFCLGMSSLQSVNIPKKTTKILRNTFNRCSSLKNVSLPEGLTEIQYSAFGNCSSLESITIPSSVTSIHESAFTGCTFLRDKFINNSSLDAEANNYWGATIID